ncbi:hypothetical protein STRIP9103_09635, partial [Streptomyces ipomoeae 91-03]
SQTICLFRPGIFLPASYPDVDLGTVAATLTDCESITAATGCGEAPMVRRTWRRSWSRMRLKMPAARHRLKNPKTV